MADEAVSTDAIELATELTIAWLNNPNNRASADEVLTFLKKMHSTLNELSSGSGQETSGSAERQDYIPAVTVRKSLSSPDHIISMIDGKPYRTLRRHLSGHGLTPEDYRQRYNLKPDYPMVAPAYSERRRAMAHKIGLGAKGRKKAAQPATATSSETPAMKRRRASRETPPKSG